MNSKRKEILCATRTLLVFGIITGDKKWVLRRVIREMEEILQDEILFHRISRTISISLKKIRKNEFLLTTIREIHTEDIRHAHTKSLELSANNCALLYKKIIDSLGLK